IDSRAMEARDSVLIDDPISQADHRLDLPPGRAELAAEPADMDVDRPRFDEPVVPPDALEQPIARDDTVLVLCEVAQELELASRQPHGATVDRYRHTLEVGDKVCAGVAGDARLLRPRGSTQGCANPRGELAEAEW